MSTGTFLQQSSHSRQAFGDAERNILVALPAYNEEAAIGKLLPRINATLSSQSLPFKILVVDDGSSDNTAQVVEEFDADCVQLIRHSINKGLGGALHTAFHASLSWAQPDDIILTLDADNTHPPELFHRMIQLIDEGRDIVIASRFQPGARVMGVPFNRHLMSVGARFVMQLLFPMRGVRDYTCGYRAYRAAFLQRAIDEFGDQFVSESGFSCMADVLLKMRSLDPIICEVPLILRYDQKGGASKMDVVKTMRETLKLLAARRLGKRS